MCRKADFNHSKLKGLIRERGLTQTNIAEEIGVAKASISQKLNGNTAFTAPEIFSICKILDISEENITAYFFTPKVQKFEQA